MDITELSKLTPEQKRVRIAEARGWQVHDSLAWKDRYVIDPKGQKWTPTDPRISIERLLPDYLGSLDAMHEAEKTLKHDCCHPPNFYSQYEYYEKALAVVVARASGLSADDADCVSATSATAAQRADAFLLTVG